MTAYYNEHDPFAAEWLRQLIKHGHIAEGIVDERDIQDVVPASWKDLRNAISSQESEGGQGRCASQDGPTVSQYGLAPALANLSARQAKEKGLLTSGTYGQRSTTLSVFNSLEWYLVSKLQAKTALLGSTLYKLTWKERVTPAQRLIYALRGSVPRTFVKDSGLLLSGWNTPNTNTNDQPDHSRRGRGTPLGQAKLSGWASPTVGNSKGGQSAKGMSATGKMPDGRKVAVALPHVAKLAGWGSPNASNPGGTPEQALKRKEGLPCGQSVTILNHQVQLCGPARLTVSGEMLIGSSAEMESGGQLKPGTFPLAHGIPSRVGKLRGYGNAIIPQVAAHFIEAYTQCTK